MRCIFPASWFFAGQLLILLWFTTRCCSLASAQVLPTVDGPAQARPALATVDSTVVLTDGTPFFARIIQHNGETFQLLKSIGFNAVQLPAPATREQLDEARQAGLWIVCPPPASVGLERIPFSYDPVLAWTVAENASARDLQIIRELVREIRASDLRTGRPIVADVDSHWRATGRLVDILSTGTETVGSGFPASQYSNWIGEKSASQLKPFWIDIPTEFSSDFRRQVSAMAGTSGPLPIEHQQLKFLLYEVISGGGRGIRFLSQSRLDEKNPQTQLRAATLRWLFRHLDQIEPWAGGGLAQQVNIANRPDVDVHEIRMADSRLILVQRPTGIEHLTTGDAPLKRLHLRGMNTGVSDQAFTIDENGANPFPDPRSTTGLQIKLESCPYQCCVLLTQNPLAVSHLNQTSIQATSQTSNLALRMYLTRQWFSLVQMVSQQLVEDGNGAAFVAGVMQEASTSIRNAERMQAAGNNQQALRNLDHADSRIAAVRRRLLENHLTAFNGLATTPLLSHFGLIPSHLQVMGRLASSTWNPNSLTGGDFENLQQMTSAGWINRREDLEAVTTQVELSRDAAVDGAYGLKLSAVSNGLSTQPLQAAPIWIKSAEVTVKQGQMVRIHGYVNVPKKIQGSQHGLLITDSLGGMPLASHIQKTDGWQEFTLYRAVPKSCRASIKFSLTGIGTALIDEVTIRTVDMTTPASQADAGVTQIK